MKFNYSKLLGRIRELGFTQERVAFDIGIGSDTLSKKLNNKSSFSTKEVVAICQLLDISKAEIGAYFFAQ